MKPINPVRHGKNPAAAKPGLHPRNRHQGRYDFPALIRKCPALAPFVAINIHGDESVDFASPAAVRALNRALLSLHYGISVWDIPPRYLCPPVPGRADYLHYLADLLAGSNGGVIPRGKSVRALDIGVGANCIYPLLGHAEYGWSFIGSDIDPVALNCAEGIVQANALSRGIDFRWQESAAAIFKGVVQESDFFDLTLCNPPFHASLAEAREGSERKWRNLGKEDDRKKSPALNFGGHDAELWCEGGEEGFLRRMISESAGMAQHCFWFTTLVSKASSLPAIHEELKKVRALNVKTIKMSQGQKQSRIVAWTFFDDNRIRSWRQGQEKNGNGKH
ncbi:MAG: 23S rRNA (adenine(1618)-N(6))-methyltransferase RlmF [bacterium]|nr:23S rRNA (adenine(1618)-N(6))-methyltransferase RlmF [bacterium]